MTAAKLCFLTALLVLGSAPGALRAESWNLGAVALISTAGDAQVEEVGGIRFRSGEMELPTFLSGQIRIRAEEQSSVFLRASNGILLQCSGPGSFAIERFEQFGTLEAALTETDEAINSRMIISLRAGQLIIDNRMLGEDTLIIETPIGRMAPRQGLWLMEMSYEERTGIYNFSLECLEGTLRFTDRPGNHYTIRGGQRMTGAGTASNPSIEIGDMTGDGRTHFARFGGIAASASAQDLPLSRFEEKMRPITLARPIPQAELQQRESIAPSERPLIIEFAPRSRPVTPFRGTIRPPSSFEIDAF